MEREQISETAFPYLCSQLRSEPAKPDKSTPNILRAFSAPSIVGMFYAFSNRSDVHNQTGP